MERLLKFLHKLWNRAQPGLKRAFLLPPKVTSGAGSYDDGAVHRGAEYPGKAPGA